MAEQQQRTESVITAPTKMAQMPASSMQEEVPEAATASMVEQMRKTGGMNGKEKAERLEEIVQEAAQETRQ